MHDTERVRLHDCDAASRAHCRRGEPVSCRLRPLSEAGRRVAGSRSGSSDQRLEGPYLKDLHLDPWQQPFVYTESKPKPEIGHLVPIGSPAASVDADISSLGARVEIPTTRLEARVYGLVWGIWLAGWIILIGCLYLLLRVQRRVRDADSINLRNLVDQRVSNSSG